MHADARVPFLENPENVDEFSLVVGLRFAPALKETLKMVHPEHQLTRNSQHGLDDFVSLMIRNVCNTLKSKQLAFSKENMLTILPDIVTREELAKYAKTEMEKFDTCMDTWYTEVRGYVIETFPDLVCENTDSESEREEWIHGVKSCVKLIEYLTFELLELGGYNSRDAATRSIGMGHISSAVLCDEDLIHVFQHITFGQLLPTLFLNLSHYVKIETIQKLSKEAKGRMKHDDFIHNQVCNRNSSSSSSSISNRSNLARCSG
jgi:hypothetical protein